MGIKVDKRNEIEFVDNYIKKEQTPTTNRCLSINITVESNIPFVV